MKKMGERIEQIRLEQGLSKSDIWKPAGLTSGVYSQWLNGNSLSGRNLLTVAKVLGVNPDWLATGKGDKYINALDELKRNLSQSDLSIQIPLLSVPSYSEYNVLIINVLRVIKSWIAKTLDSVSSINNLCFTHAVGDSMHPTFSNGDILLVDTGVNSVVLDGVYVLESNSRLYIKRVRRRLDGSIEISSDNPSVKSVDLLNDEIDITVRGRVVWAWIGKHI